MPKLWNKVSEKLRQTLPEGSHEEFLGDVVGFVTQGGVFSLRSPNHLALLSLEQDYGLLLEQLVRSYGFVGGVRYDLSPAVEPVAEPVVDISSQLGLFERPSSPVRAARLDLREEQAALRVDSFNDAKRHFEDFAPLVTEGYTLYEEGAQRLAQQPPKVTEELIQAAGLQKQYTLSTWVHGEENKITYGAAQAIVQGDVALCNPLFIQGGTGTGKTHLLQGIGLEALRQRPTARVRYLRAETFLNEFVEAISNKAMPAFRQRMRSDIDLLILDDLEFLSGKTQCQTELMHTLNDLLHTQKRVVLASSALREDLVQFDAKLLSQLSIGLTVRIDRASEDTRLAILRQLADRSGEPVQAEVLEFLARTVRTDNRAMIGHFTRILTFARLGRTRVSMDFARSQLDQSYKQEKIAVTVDAVVEEIVAFYQLKREEIVGRGRTKRVVTPRKVAMYLARSLTEMSFPELGRFFDNRDHSTIIDACKSIGRELSEDRELQHAVKTIERRLIGS